MADLNIERCRELLARAHHDPFSLSVASELVVLLEAALAEIERLKSHNWFLIEKEIEPLINKMFVDDRGDQWRLVGASTDGEYYYYMMFRNGKYQWLSCVGSLENHGFELSEKDGEDDTQT